MAIVILQCFIMLTILHFVCVLLLLGGGLCIEKVLNFSLLNQGETISIFLASYLDAPKQATLDKVHSTNIDALSTQLTTNQPLLNVSSVPLKVTLPNGTDYLFNSSDVMESCSLYNQPNKLFLMRGNILLSVRYQFSPSDSPYSVAVAVMEGGGECTEVSVMENYGNYYAVVGCLKSENVSVLYAFRFNSTDPGTVNGLIPLDPLNITLSSCLRLQTYAFRQFSLNVKTYYNSILYYCAQGKRPGEPSNLYFLSIQNRKGVDNLIAVEPSYSFPARFLRQCLQGSEWVGKYQQGMIILQGGSLYYYKYDRASDQSICDPVMDVQGVSYVDGVQDQQIQYIYVMFNDKIIIKESYSPNFQTVPLRRANLTLHSYAITRKLLVLLFHNATHQNLAVYDLVRNYPTEVDQMTWAKTKSELSVYPVSNFLQTGNYFITLDQLGSQLLLNYYQGYVFTFSVKDPTKAIPHVTVNISNQQNQNLVLECSIKDFNDSSVAQASDNRFLITYRQLLSVNLSDYVEGPLGRFYNYPNNISAFQYINEYSQVDLAGFVKMAGRPLAISFNNYLNAAVINFYYSALAKTCELSFASRTQTVSLSDCKTLTRKKSQLENAKQIVVLSEDKYLQYNQSILQYCALSSNNEFECIGIAVPGMSGFQRVRLVKYFFSKNTDEVIQLLLHNPSQVLFCCFQRNVYYGSQFNFTLHYHATSNNLPDLATWHVKSLLFDPGYTQYLALHLYNQTAHRVVVFDRPFYGKNSSSFIGHVMEKLEFAELEAVFSVGSLLVCISPSVGGWLLQEYKITKYYRVRENRRYPLYHFTVSKGGDHAQDGDFIYLQALQGKQSVYIVYSPLRSSFSILSHKFAKNALPIIFAQQIGEVTGNSMGLNGQKLFGLVPPSLTFKFLNLATEGVNMGKYKFQVSVLDSSSMMSLLTYEFYYNQGEESIRYDDSLDLQVRFDDDTDYQEFHINPQKVHGPVNGYQLQLPNDNSCNFFSVETRDVFTKEGCLAYTNPAQYGILSDFLALSVSGISMELLVTDQALNCVVNRQLFTGSGIELNGLANCKFEKSQQDILMVCDNSTSIGKLLYNVTVGAGGLGCVVGLTSVKLPRWFSYGDFAVKLSGGWLALEVPIRYRQNCIYYKTTIIDNTIAEPYSLLVGNSAAQSQFQTRDTSISPQLFFILQKGIGIYNLSDYAKQIMPALWLPQSNISSVILDDGALVYLKFLNLSAKASGQMSITVQLGTEQSAYQLVIDVTAVDSGIDGQTFYNKTGLRVAYQYKQYMSCKNNLQSKSQNYGSLIIKICNYEPPDELVFANFVSIANETTGALIQFYNRSGISSYPFRIDTIYSNFLSHHSFLIRENTLIVASLFNLLCYYALANTLTWQFHFTKVAPPVDSDRRTDLQCFGTLIISNLQFKKELKVEVTYDYDEEEQDYWTNGTYYIQRVLVVLLLANAIRLLWRTRSKNTIKLRKRFSTRLHTNRFEVMVKINSKKSS